MEKTNSLFNYLNIIHCLDTPLDMLSLEDYCVVDTTDMSFPEPREVSMNGEIFKIDSLRDYKIGERLHTLRLSGKSLRDLETAATTALTIAVLDSAENSKYRDFLSMLNSSDVDRNLKDFAMEMIDVETYLANLFIDEYSLRCDILQELIDVRDLDTLKTVINKYSEGSVEGSVESFLVDIIDDRVLDEGTALLDGPEYCVQEPFPCITGVFSKKSKEVRFLSNTLFTEDYQWSDVEARQVWERANDKEIREKAVIDTSINLILREMDVLTASLALRGVTVEGEGLRGRKRTKLLKTLRKVLF